MLNSAKGEETKLSVVAGNEGRDIIKYSIIVPVYNTGVVLNDCVRSLATQSTGNYEILLVDDGSTDSSGEICDVLAGQLPTVRVFHKDNGGPYLARKFGAQKSCGDYLLFVDSDDALAPRALECLDRAIEEFGSPSIVSFCYSQSLDFGESCKDLNLTAGVYYGSDYQRVREFALEGRFNMVWGKAVRRDVALASFSQDLSKMRYGEDLVQVLAMVDAGDSCVSLWEPLYYYRETPASASRSFRCSYLDDERIVFERIWNCVNKWGVDPNIARGGILRHLYFLVALFERSGSTDERHVLSEFTGEVFERYGLKCFRCGDARDLRNKALSWLYLHRSYRLFCIFRILQDRLVKVRS